MDNFELDLRTVFRILHNRLIVIIVAMLLCGAAAFSYAHFYVAPKYEARVKLYVYSDTERSSTTVTNTELTASKSLVDTYIVVLESDTVMDAVIDELNLSCTSSDLRKKISASVVDETEVFSVTVTDSSALQAQRIANTIANIAPQEIIRVVKAGGVEVVDYAKLPTIASSPSMPRYTIIGLLIGFVLSFGGALLLACTDTKVHGEEDLTNTFTIPVLGTVPTFESVNPQKGVYQHDSKA